MKEMIVKADQLLALIPVNGEAVFAMADARKILAEAYRIAEKTEVNRSGSEGHNGEKKETEHEEDCERK